MATGALVTPGGRALPAGRGPCRNEDPVRPGRSPWIRRGLVLALLVGAAWLLLTAVSGAARADEFLNTTTEPLSTALPALAADDPLAPLPDGTSLETPLPPVGDAVDAPPPDPQPPLPPAPTIPDPGAADLPVIDDPGTPVLDAEPVDPVAGPLTEDPLIVGDGTTEIPEPSSPVLDPAMPDTGTAVSTSAQVVAATSLPPVECDEPPAGTAATVVATPPLSDGTTDETPAAPAPPPPPPSPGQPSDTRPAPFGPAYPLPSPPAPAPAPAAGGPSCGGAHGPHGDADVAILTGHHGTAPALTTAAALGLGATDHGLCAADQPGARPD